MRINHSDNTVSVNSSSMMAEQVRHDIKQVLLLNGDASSGLAALLGNLELIIDSNIPGLTLASNQREAVFDLRKAAFGY